MVTNKNGEALSKVSFYKAKPKSNKRFDVASWSILLWSNLFKVGAIRDLVSVLTGYFSSCYYSFKVGRKPKLIQRLWPWANHEMKRGINKNSVQLPMRREVNILHNISHLGSRVVFWKVTPLREHTSFHCWGAWLRKRTVVLGVIVKFSVPHRLFRRRRLNYSFLPEIKVRFAVAMRGVHVLPAVCSAVLVLLFVETGCGQTASQEQVLSLWVSQVFVIRAFQYLESCRER